MAIPQKYEQYPAPAGTQYPHPLIQHRRNLIRNPAFSSNLTFWHNVGGIYTGAQTFSRPTGGVTGVAGDNYGRCTINTLGTPDGDFASYSFIADSTEDASGVQGTNESYTMSAWVRGTAGKGIYIRMVRWVAVSGGLWGNPNHDKQLTVLATGNWQYLSISNAAWMWPYETTTIFDCRIGLRHSADGVVGSGAAAVGNTVDVDAVVVEPTETHVSKVYFDGSSDWGGWWEGSTNGSPSGAGHPRARINFAENPSFEYGTGRWSAGVGGPGGSVAATQTNAWRASSGGVGQYSMRLNGTLGSGGYLIAECFPLTPKRLKPSTPYTLSMYTKVVTALPQMYTNIVWQDEAGAYIGETNGTPVTFTGERRISHTATSPAACAFGWLRFQCAGANTAPFDIYLDDILWEESDELRVYFDGDNQRADWNSTDGDSTSRLYSPGGQWVDLGSAVGGLGGQSEAEFKFPRTGVTFGAISRTPANRRSSSMELAPGVQRSAYVLEKPFHDDFRRANESRLLQPFNVIGGTQDMQLQNQQITATERGSDDYGYAGSNFQLDLPMIVRVTLGTRADNPNGNSGWDEYLELGTDPFNANLPESFEFGWFRRPGWGGEMVDNLDHYALWWLHPDGGGSTPSERMVPAPDAALGTAPMPGPPVKSGDQMALAYDGVSVIAMRKPVGLPWFLIRREPLSTLAHPPVTRPLYGGVWTANYIVDVGTNGIASFSYGRF